MSLPKVTRSGRIVRAPTRFNDYVQEEEVSSVRPVEEVTTTNAATMPIRVANAATMPIKVEVATAHAATMLVAVTTVATRPIKVEATVDAANSPAVAPVEAQVTAANEVVAAMPVEATSATMPVKVEAATANAAVPPVNSQYSATQHYAAILASAVPLRVPGIRPSADARAARNLHREQLKFHTTQIARHQERVDEIKVEVAAKPQSWRDYVFDGIMAAEQDKIDADRAASLIEAARREATQRGRIDAEWASIAAHLDRADADRERRRVARSRRECNAWYARAEQRQAPTPTGRCEVAAALSERTQRDPWSSAVLWSSGWPVPRM